MTLNSRAHNEEAWELGIVLVCKKLRTLGGAARCKRRS